MNEPPLTSQRARKGLLVDVRLRHAAQINQTPDVFNDLLVKSLVPEVLDDDIFPNCQFQKKQSLTLRAGD